MVAYLLAVVWGQVDHQREVQRVGAGGQCLVQDSVLADVVDADAVASQMKLEPVPAQSANASVT
jgi:hypothetical protein